MSTKLYIAASALFILSAPGAIAEPYSSYSNHEGGLSNSSASQTGRSRAEVLAEGREAMRAGAFDGEVSHWTYPASTRPRVQVAAEGRESMRLGIISHSDLTRLPTQEELRQIQLAGEQALARDAAGQAQGEGEK